MTCYICGSEQNQLYSVAGMLLCKPCKLGKYRCFKCKNHFYKDEGCYKQHNRFRIWWCWNCLLKDNPESEQVYQRCKVDFEEIE